MSPSSTTVFRSPPNSGVTLLCAVGVVPRTLTGSGIFLAVEQLNRRRTYADCFQPKLANRGVIRLDRNPSTRERDKLSFGKMLSLVTVVRLIVNDVLFAVLHSIAVVRSSPIKSGPARGRRCRPSFQTLSGHQLSQSCDRISPRTVGFSPSSSQAEVSTRTFIGGVFAESTKIRACAYAGAGELHRR
jgi:hypothetical protein